MIFYGDQNDFFETFFSPFFRASCIYRGQNVAAVQKTKKKARQALCSKVEVYSTLIGPPITLKSINEWSQVDRFSWIRTARPLFTV